MKPTGIEGSLGSVMAFRNDPLPISRLRAALLVFCILWLSLLCWWHRRVVIDDPWITYRYAENLLAGHGLAFNPGEPLEGYSNLLWVLLTLPALAANVEPLGWSRLLSLLCAMAILGLLVFGWRHPADSETPSRSGTAALFLASMAPLAVWVMGGLETILQSLLILTAALATARLLVDGSGRAAALAAGSLMLLILTRPEGFGFLPLLALGLMRSRSVRPAAAALGAVSAFLALYTFWRFQTFGTIVANTASAKVGGGIAASSLSGLGYLFRGLAGPTLVVALLAAWTVVSRIRGLLHPAEWTEEHCLVVSLAAAAIAQLAFAVVVGGDWMPAGRFIVPALAPLCLLAAIAIRRWHLFVRLVIIGFMLVGGVLHARSDFELRLLRWMAKVSGPRLVSPLEEVGRQLRLRSEPTDWVAGGEAGIIPYTSKLPFIDTLGLVDAHIASLPGRLHEKFDVDYVLAREPRWIIVTLVEEEGGERAEWAVDRAFLGHPAFQLQYAEAFRIPRPLPGVGMELRRAHATVWERRERIHD